MNEKESHDIYEGSRITKVVHSKKDTASVYVFCGSQYPTANVPTDDDAYFEFIKKTGFFSQSELSALQSLPSKRTQIVLVNDRINMDDTIYQIKLKILKHVSIGEDSETYPLTTRTIYLYSKFTKDLTLQRVFNELSHGNKTSITVPIMINYLSNIYGAQLVDMNRVGSNHIFSYNDLKKLEIFSGSESKNLYLNGETTCTVSVPLGYSYHPNVNKASTWAFSADPFVSCPFLPMSDSDTTFKNESRKMLMEYGLPLHNTLYMCSYKDVDSMVDNEKSKQRNKNGYFPFLKEFEQEHNYNEQIVKQALLQEVSKEKQEIDDSVVLKNVNFFYDVYDRRVKTISNLEGVSSNFSYLSTGVSSLNIVFTPIILDRALPVDAIFKTLCSSEAIPFIKIRYSGKAGDSVFKLHAPNVNKYGNRVPKITLGDFNRIDRLCKSRQRIDCISLYFQEAATAIHKNIRYVVIEIDNAAKIDVQIQLFDREMCSVHDMNRVISSILNPILMQVNILFEQSGINIPHFETVYDTDHVKIVSMQYDLNINHSKQVDLNQLIPKCGNGIFYSTPESTHSKSGVYEFERVGETRPDGLKVKVAFQGGYLDKSGNPYTQIRVSGITCIHLLSTVLVYLDAAMRIFHNDLTSFPKEQIQKMCFSAPPQQQQQQQQQQLEPNTDSDDNETGNNDEGGLDLGNGSDDSENDEWNGGASRASRGSGKKSRVAAEDAPAGKKTLLSLLKDADSGLFDVAPNQGTAPYATCCTLRSANNKTKNQPIALTDAEMDEYERTSGIPVNSTWSKESKSFWRYSYHGHGDDKNAIPTVYAIRFGSTKSNMRWYICPQFWNKTTGKAVTDREAEHLKSEHKGTLPAHVEEFSVPGTKYTPLFPGLVTQGDGRKMPCCFSQTLNSLRVSVDVLKEIKKQTKEAKEKHQGAKFTFPKYGIGLIPKWQEDILETGVIPPLDELNEKIRKEERANEAVAEAQGDAETLARDASNRGKGKDNFGDNILKADSKLGSAQLGHLPVALQRFFNTTDKCEPRSGCLLRYGIETNNISQSFLSAIACVYNSTSTPSVSKMRTLVADSISLDAFVSYNNGTLVTQFVSESEEIDINDDTRINEWLIDNKSNYGESSAVYAKLMQDPNPDSKEAADKKALLYRICMALSKFKGLLQGTGGGLDHTLLWDVVTSPNPSLFKNGINLMILEIPNNDDTHNVNVLCPPNRHAEQVFDHRKSVAFLVKRTVDGVPFYEPLCLFGKRPTGAGDKTVQFLFNLHSNIQLTPYPAMFENVKRVITYIRNLQTVHCPSVISSLNFVSHTASSGVSFKRDIGHKFKRNLHAKRIEHLLLQNGFEVHSQVLNYDNRVIGLVASYNKANKPPGYVPTESSELILNEATTPKYDIHYTDDTAIPWMPYDMTVSFLKFVSRMTGVPCTPVANVTDDSDDSNKALIIGVLTETNQFVRTAGPEPPARSPTGEILSDVPTALANAIGVKDHFTIDKAVLLDRGYVTSGRADFIRRIELETNFYNAFRITARHLLTNAMNTKTSVTGIESIGKQIYDTAFAKREYDDKLKTMKALLKELMQNSVSFDDYDTSALSKIEACFTPGSCDGVNARAYCARDDEVSTPAGIKCKLRIPANRLMESTTQSHQSHPKMESLFYSRLADELIRYARMRDFMFTERPNDYYLISRIPKVVCENELILTQSMIDGTGEEGNDGFFKNEENQPDTDKAKNMGTGIGVNTSAFNLKRKKVTKREKYTQANEEQFSTGLQQRKEVVKAALPSSVDECMVKNSGPYTMTVFQGIFPGDAQDERIVKNGDITFALFVNMLHLQKKLGAQENVGAVKKKLVEAYNDVLKMNLTSGRSGTQGQLTTSKICNLWTKCGSQMNRLAREILDGKLTIETAIQSPVYTMTPFDIWLLSMEYEVQVILFSGSSVENQQRSDINANMNKRFYCNGCNSRVLYADSDSDPNTNPNASEYFVLVAQNAINQFPVYGIVQYAHAVGGTFSIRAKDINFDVSSVYRTNELITDFIENISVAPAAAAATAPAATASPAASVAAAARAAAALPVAAAARAASVTEPKNQKQISLTDSLPLIQMKQKGQLSAVSEADESESGEEEDEENEENEENEEEKQSKEEENNEEEVHSPQIKALLEKSRDNLDSALTRLSKSQVATSDVRQKSYSDKEKVDNIMKN